MGIRTVPFQQLVPAETGIIASGVTTNAGAWSPDVNIDTYLTSKGVAYPSDATGVLIAIINSTSGQNWAGIRKSGAAVNHALHDQYALSTSYIFVPCAPGEALQFYAENITNIKFYVVGIIDDSVAWYPPSSAFPFILRQGTGNWDDRNVPTPLGSTLIFGWQALNPASRIRNNGETHEPDPFDNFSTFKLPADNNIEIKSFTDMPYVGYFQSGVDQPAWRTVAFTPTKGVWTKAPVSYPGKAFVHITSDFTGGSNQLLFRPASGAAQSFAWGTVRNGKNQWVMLDSAGEFEYFASASATINNIWVDAIVDNYSEGVAAVTGPATIQAGVPFDIISSTFGGPIVSVEVEDELGNVINITPSATTLTVPEPTSGTDYVLFGDLTITLYSATKQASFDSELLPGAGMAVTPMGVQHIGPGNISHGWPVPLSDGDQVYYPTANATVVYEDGRFSTNNTGEWTIFAIYQDGFTESSAISSEGDLPAVTNPKFLQSKALQSKFLEPKFLTVKFL